MALRCSYCGAPAEFLPKRWWQRRARMRRHTCTARENTRRDYVMWLDFTAANDDQAERLAQAWAGTCAAEYGTRYRGLVRLRDGAILFDAERPPRTLADDVAAGLHDRPHP